METQRRASLVPTRLTITKTVSLTVSGSWRSTHTRSRATVENEARRNSESARKESNAKMTGATRELGCKSIRLGLKISVLATEKLSSVGKQGRTSPTQGSKRSSLHAKEIMDRLINTDPH